MSAETSYRQPSFISAPGVPKLPYQPANSLLRTGNSLLKSRHSHLEELFVSDPTLGVEPNEDDAAVLVPILDPRLVALFVQQVVSGADLRTPVIQPIDEIFMGSAEQLFGLGASIPRQSRSCVSAVMA